MLTHLVALAHSAFEGRSEFELAEEGATRDVKRFVLKIHGKRVIAISMRIEGGRALLDAHAIERSNYDLSPGEAVAADFQAADGTWIADALQQQFSRIRLQAA